MTPSRRVKAIRRKNARPTIVLRVPNASETYARDMQRLLAREGLIRGVVVDKGER